VSLLNKPHRISLLCYVTDRQSLREEDAGRRREALLGRIRNAAEAGVDWIQIRERDLLGKECSRLTVEALRGVAEISPVQGAKACILVNDRLDVALAAGAGGVHLGEKSVSVRDAKRLREALHRERDFLIGVSCHSLEAAKSAEEQRADYIFFGPVFATPSKAEYGAPQGVERLAEVCQAVTIPVLAIGGITVENCANCFAAGAAGIAAIRLFQDAPDVSAVVRLLRH